MRLAIQTLACGLITWAAMGTAAATEPQLSPSEALRCMTPPEQGRGPAYPDHAYRRKASGIVAVEMTFTQADRSPRVKVLDGSDLIPDLIDAVTEHVASFRVPCLAAGQRVTIRQEFKFVPDDGRKVVQWSQARDHSQQARKEKNDCKLQRLKPPAYPRNAQSLNQEGTVPLRLRFTDSVNPPQITVLDNTAGGRLIEAANEVVREARLPLPQRRSLGV